MKTSPATLIRTESPSAQIVSELDQIVLTASCSPEYESGCQVSIAERVKDRVLSGVSYSQLMFELEKSVVRHIGKRKKLAFMARIYNLIAFHLSGELQNRSVSNRVEGTRTQTKGLVEKRMGGSVQ